jgi:amidase
LRIADETAPIYRGPWQRGGIQQPNLPVIGYLDWYEPSPNSPVLVALSGKRLGLVRDFMIEATIADRDSIRVATDALAEMKQLGATIVDPVDFHSTIAEVMAAYEPSFFTQVFPEAIPAGAKPIDRVVAIASDPRALAGGVRGVNLRMLAGQQRGEEAKYALNLYLKERGDVKFRSVEDVFATKAFLGENDHLRNLFGVKAETLDTPNNTSHALRQQTLRRILYKVMADNNLDALVYPYNTVPPPLVFPAGSGASIMDASSRACSRPEPSCPIPACYQANRRWKKTFELERQPQPGERLPCHRRAGWVHKRRLRPRAGRQRSERQPPRRPKRDQLPVAMEFLARPFDEALLFEIASAYEAGTKHRRPRFPLD